MWRLILAMWVGAALVAAVPSKPPKKKSTAHSTVSSKSRHARRKTTRARARKPPAPSFQLHPDPERYQQIQQALAERGYYKGTPDGKWNDDSADALKRFQADQKLEPDGKINALTLTGLGLGPKHDGSSAGSVPLAAANTDSPAPPPVAEVPAGTDPQ